VNLGNPDRPVGGLAVPRPEGVEIRPAGREDAGAALALVRAHRAAQARTDDTAERARFALLVGDVDALPLLALAEGEPIGFIDFRFRRRLNHATFEGWIGELHVTEAHRARGIGRALLASAIAEWRLRGGHQVEIELRRDEVAAYGLSHAAGLIDQGLFFEIAPVRVRGIVPGPGVSLRAIADHDADFDAATALLAELGRPTPAPDRLPALRRTYAAHVARGDTASMLADLDGVPVGFISLEFRDRIGAEQPEAWIPDLIVTEAARGRDIGAALLDAAFAEAERRAASAVKLESGSHRKVAHALYRAAGMADVGSFLTLTR
jgi:ribosomal protein S18 acetylase RimI-like enzyme